MTKKKTIKKASPSIYNAMVKKVIDDGNGIVTVQLELVGKGFTFTERHTLKTVAPESIIEAGHMKFFVACDRLGIYTSIGADNIHHASNKATKLFGPHWSFIRDYYHSHDLGSMQHYPVAQFNELLRTLQN